MLKSDSDDIISITAYKAEIIVLEIYFNKSSRINYCCLFFTYMIL